MLAVLVAACGQIEIAPDATPAPSCDPDPCLNGGVCSADVSGVTCECPDGYTGDLCETNIDDCNPNPCQNGGTCFDGVDAYMCMCAADWNGPDCTQMGCAAGLTLCGGACVDLLTDNNYCSDDGTCGPGCSAGETCNGGGVCLPATGSVTFTFTGQQQTFVVPQGITSVDVDATGGKGGDGWNVDGGGSVKGLGGGGGRIQGTLAVTPGETLYLLVGGAGADATTQPGVGGFNGGGDGRESPSGYAGGGGGGASDVRRGGVTLDQRVLVAGGGGAGSGWCTAGTGNGGDGGGPTAVSGEMCTGIAVGTGGTQNRGGITGGAFGVGGTEMVPASDSDAGSGGGGGWYGGGSSNGSGAGGGSSYAHPGSTANVIHQRGGGMGDGEISISW